MNRKKKRTLTLLFVVLLCLISTCLLAVVAFCRSRQVQMMEPAGASVQEMKAPEGYDLFWNGDETLLTRENVVVFDIRYTDMDEEILIDLAYCIEEEIQNKGIQPIFIGAETTSELRSNILKSEEMNLYIGLCVGRDDNQETFGTLCFYNDAYYVPDFNNAWLCDRLLQNVVTGINGKALGMELCSERDIMVGLSVPSGLLQIGYQTNSTEGEMLQETEYLNMIARGIVETVEEYYEGE